MPEKETVERAKRDKRQGKSPSTQAGEFVREEIHHVREGKHGARSAKQAIAIGLSKARRAGVKLPPSPSGKVSDGPKRAAPSRKRSQAMLQRLKKEPTGTVSHDALARQAHAAAVRRGPAKRKQAAKKAARTRSHQGR